MEDTELLSLLRDLESDRVERKESAADGSRIRQAICAFANDMPGHARPGVIFVGVRDNGTCAHLSISDELLRQLADMRSDGNILPIPVMRVQKKTLNGCDTAVVIVEPSLYPPVRYNGRIWIRVGPRRATASAEEERRLAERRQAADLPFDLHPLQSAQLDDLDIDLFQRTYLPAAFSIDVLDQNERTVEQQLASLRFISRTDDRIPTVVGVLTLGKSPADFIPGAYLQFLRIDGTGLSDPISDQKDCHGPLPELLTEIDSILSSHIRIAADVTSAATETRSPDYPIAALQQLVRNAIMHRDFHTSNAPTRITWFIDRIEIQNPGGPYGQVTVDNFGQPGITDYRNPHVAEAMRTLGYVQRFGIGIQIARKQLADNGNPPPEFQVQQSHVLAIVRRRS
ncbi:MAG: transcriptional regulator [Planctomycetaceae bacterium]|nr:transcriptional regulator [Planctomycetaceae bacterium]